MGFGKGVSSSALAKANEQRSWKIYRDFTDHIISKAKKLNLGSNESEFSFSNPIYAVDSTTIDLCLSVFGWANHKTTKATIKVHTQLDVRTSIPVSALVSEAAIHDVNAMNSLSYEPGSYYIFDRAYLDFQRLYVIHSIGAFFVIRGKKK